MCVGGRGQFLTSITEVLPPFLPVNEAPAHQSLTPVLRLLSAPGRDLAYAEGVGDHVGLLPEDAGQEEL